MAGLKRFGKGCADRIEIHICRTSQQCGFIENSDCFESRLPEFAEAAAFFAIGSLCDVLAEQSHPPTDVAQATANSSQTCGIAPYRVEFSFIGFSSDGLTYAVLGDADLSGWAQEQPTASDGVVIPRSDHIWPRSQYQMQMIGHQGKGEEINPHVGSQLLQFALDPKFSVIKVFFGYGIETQEIATSYSARHNVHDGNFRRIKDLCASESSHDMTLHRKTRPILGKKVVPINSKIRANGGSRVKKNTA
jgi:hypothetical protein